MEIKNFSFAFNQRSAAIFENLNLQIHQNQFTVILGTSGTGKSTLLRLLAGLNQGVILKGEILNQASTKQLKQTHSSFVFQESNLLPWLNVQENILLPMKIRPKLPPKTEIGSSRSEMDFNYLVELCDIKDHLQKYPNQLSGGQKMRVALARALVTKPQTLFLDEPFSALDEPTRHLLQQFIKDYQIKNQLQLIFVTHSFYEAAFLADRIIILGKSKDKGLKNTVISADLSFENSVFDRFSLDYNERVKMINSKFHQFI